MHKRIAVSQLRLGMYIHEFCGSWMEHPFWRTAFLLDDPDDLRRIIDCGITEVWIDTARGLDVAAGEEGSAATEQSAAAEVNRALLAAASAGSQPVKRLSLAEEAARAARICAAARTAVSEMFHEARLGKAIDSARSIALVEEISGSVQRNPGAIISLARLKNRDEYTYMHSVAVCALMIGLARELGLDEQQTRDAGQAGLLHDVGKMMIPDSILNKPGKLTDDEFARMREHPAEGHRLLSKASTPICDVAMDVCLHHHEKTDGSGYPHRLVDAQISLFAKMGAICDVYDAITSNRPYKAGWNPAESLRKMAEWCKGHFDPKLFHAFVKCVGIYPVGSLVRLQSGRLAVVIEQHEEALLTPRVRAFFSTRSNARIPPEIIDLARPGCADKVIGAEDPEKWRFPDLEALWMNAAGLK